MERSRQSSLLYEAACQGSVPSLLELLQQDRLLLDRAMISNQTSLNETPLHIAAMLGHADFAKEILRRKPELAEELDSNRSSPLHLAAARGHAETVRALLAVGAEMCFALDGDGRNPVHVAAVRGRVEALREMVGAAPEAARAVSGWGETALHLCVRHGRVEGLRVLVEVMVTVMDDYQFVNARDDFGMTILHLAVACKQIETVKYLLANTRVEVNAVTANGFTALDILAQSPRDAKDLDISDSLRAAGASRAANPPPESARRKHQEIIPSTLILTSNINDKPAENWLSRKRESLMVVASLIATMAFQAGTNPPGGLWQDDSSNGTASSGGSAGKAIMAYRDSGRYDLYLYYNTAGFVGSLSIILLLITGLPFQRRLFMWALTVIVWVTITMVALTYRVAVLFFTPPELVHVANRVVSYGVTAWASVMGFVLVVHTISVAANLLARLAGFLPRPRRKPFFTAPTTGF